MGEPLGTTFSLLENRPIHLNPEMIRLASDEVGNVTSSFTLATRVLYTTISASKKERLYETTARLLITYLSDASAAPVAFCVTSAQVKSAVSHSVLASFR